MGIIYILIPLSLILGLFGFTAFLWALRSGQFDDLDTPPIRILFDEKKTGDIRDRDDS